MIAQVRREYSKRKNEIKQRLQEFKKADDFFYELCFCLLTPQSNGVRCGECIEILKTRKFEDTGVNLIPILQKYTRFHNTKAKRLEEFKIKHKLVIRELKKKKSTKDQREYILNEINGFGMKESSHFLRNIGHENLAILDRHILKNLKKLNVIKDPPKTMTKIKYLEIEMKFQNFGNKINIPMDHLDLLFWSMETGRIFK